MRRHLEPIQQNLCLSVEEEAILVDEQSAMVTELDSNEEEADRLLDTADVVDQTKIIVSQIQNPTDIDRQLVTTVGEMAAAGTDAEPSEILSLPEGESVVTEGLGADIKDRLMKLWEKIREFILHAYNKIKEFFLGREKQLATAAETQKTNDEFVNANEPKLLLLAGPKLMLGYSGAAPDSQADNNPTESSEEAKRKYEAAIQKLQSVFESHKFHFKGQAPLLGILGTVPNDFEKKLSELLHYSEETHKTLARALRDICQSYDQIVANFKGGSPEAGVGAFCDAYHKKVEVLMRGIGEVKDKEGMLFCRTKESYVGGFAINATDKKDEGGAGSLAAQIKLAAQTKIEYEVGTKTGADVPLIKDTASKNYGVAINRWLKFATSDQVKGVESELNEFSNKFVQHIDHLVTAQKTIAGSDEAGDSYNTLQGMIDLSRTISAMIIKFTTSHIRNSLSIVRAAQDYQAQSNSERIRLFNEAMKEA